MQGNILYCYPVILPSRVMLPSDFTLVSAFYVQDNILSDFPAILPSQIILYTGDVIVVSAGAIVRIQYDIFYMTKVIYIYI